MLQAASLAFDLDQDGVIGRYEAAYGALRVFDQEAGPEAEYVAVSRVSQWLTAAGRAALAPVPTIADDGEVDWPKDPGSGLAFALSPDGRTAVVRGSIDTGGLVGFFELLLTAPRLNEVVLQEVASPSAEASRHFARLLRDSGLTSRIPNGGTLVAPGLEIALAAQRRYVETGALVGQPDAAGEVTWLSAADVEASGLRTEVEGMEVGNVGSNASLRGLAAVTSDIAWATGSGATVARTVDGGKTWKNRRPRVDRRTRRAGTSTPSTPMWPGS